MKKKENGTKVFPKVEQLSRTLILVAEGSTPPTKRHFKVWSPEGTGKVALTYLGKVHKTNRLN
jgi:hypothetical protein